jgi:hypothetical protein
LTANGKKKIVKPPWYEDGQPERWVTTGRFALLMNRHPCTVRTWTVNGTLNDFGFAWYRDWSGTLYIKISAEDLKALRKIEAMRGSKASAVSA